MTISARNQLAASVKSIKSGAVNDQIELTLNGGETLVAVITSDSTQKLGLSEGSSVVAIFKAPSVILSTDTDLILSARNQLQAHVEKITHGAVNAEVLVKTTGGVAITTIITEQSVKNLALEVGSAVNVLIKASHVLLGVKK
ncbi:TOBE domain-containing protein [Testudinibacter sp. TR-2022]|uniref:TOBE domain-containing protein n=1 Tax=Testudinibacter sp. TR-2022 TaxID=2585029 RepID=UPI001118B4C5|nr:TOBE domain-containing protein [Testudinibacter sp. TR-2022]TNH03379.1 transporter [Pasteurellaceae bacterium Phil11]TNH21389.1 transporter [Testudinibacter sp. TR-2022]TNH23583.1 transporter [Testudinibacter sp. TR-2022]